MKKYTTKRKYNKKYNIKSKTVASRKLNKKYKTRKKIRGGGKEGTGYGNNITASKNFAIEHRNNILKTIMNMKKIKDKMDKILMKTNVSLGNTQTKLIDEISNAIIDVLNKHKHIQQSTEFKSNSIYSTDPNLKNKNNNDYIDNYNSLKQNTSFRSVTKQGLYSGTS